MCVWGGGGPAYSPEGMSGSISESESDDSSSSVNTGIWGREVLFVCSSESWEGENV